MDTAIYGKFETAWCPGCGNHGLLEGVKRALAVSGLAPHQVIFVSGIGQAAKAPHYLRCNLFNGLHGRDVPVATGVKLANHALPVIAESGDGDIYGEGGNHFLAAIRRNPDITVLVHNNQVYALTKGQASPTSGSGFASKAQPLGSPEPLNPLTLAVSQRAGLVARGFTGKIAHLAGLVRQAIAYRGLAIIDVLQPCVTFNHENTFKWYQDRVYELPADYNPADWHAALSKADEWGEHIPIGVIWREKEKTVNHDRFPALSQGPLLDRKLDPEALRQAMERYF